MRQQVRDAGFAALVVAAVVATEYAFRHYVLFWMPTLASLRVNDMVALAMAYSLLVIAFGALAGADWRGERRELAAAFWAFVTQWRYTLWLLGMMACLVVLPTVDQWLWEGRRLPMWVSDFRNPAIWLAGARPFLEVVAVVGVNGLLVPVAEEYLWRGLVQARLARLLPAAAAIGVTAVVFSLKHVLVDASWGRFLTLVAFGAICGALAQRHSWRSSAALHLVVNTASTTVALALGRS
jgi:membrane protease YdiL (CAAX protease family)